MYYMYYIYIYNYSYIYIYITVNQLETLIVYERFYLAFN